MLKNKVLLVAALAASVVFGGCDKECRKHMDDERQAIVVKKEQRVYGGSQCNMQKGKCTKCYMQNGKCKCIQGKGCELCRKRPCRCEKRNMKCNMCSKPMSKCECDMMTERTLVTNPATAVLEDEDVELDVR